MRCRIRLVDFLQFHFCSRYRYDSCARSICRGRKYTFYLQRHTIFLSTYTTTRRVEVCLCRNGRGRIGQKRCPNRNTTTYWYTKVHAQVNVSRAWTLENVKHEQNINMHQCPLRFSVSKASTLQASKSICIYELCEHRPPFLFCFFSSARTIAMNKCMLNDQIVQ